MINNSIEKRIPSEIESEKSFLGCIFIKKELINDARDLVKSSDFFEPHHKIIYEAMLKLNENQQEITIETVISEIKKSNKKHEIAGIERTIEGLIVYQPLISSFHTYVDYIRDASIKRYTIQTCESILDTLYKGKDSSNDFIDFAQEKIFKLSELRDTQDFIKASQISNEFLKQLEKRKATNGLLGITSGFGAIDQYTNGFKSSELIILGARPSVGKSAFAINLALNASRRIAGECKKVAFFSLEMSHEQIITRIISNLSGVDSRNINIGKIDGDEMKSVIFANDQLETNFDIYIGDSATININDIRAQCRKLKNDKGLDFVIIDYLQLVRSGEKSNNRQEEVQQISRGLKLMAIELGIPVLALSQLNRDVEKYKRGESSKPKLVDLRESGSLEQDADIVLLMHRLDEDKPQDFENELQPDTPKSQKIINIQIAKNRQGVSGVDVQFIFVPSTNTFSVQEDRY